MKKIGEFQEEKRRRNQLNSKRLNRIEEENRKSHKIEANSPLRIPKKLKNGEIQYHMRDWTWSIWNS